MSFYPITATAGRSQRTRLVAGVVVLAVACVLVIAMTFSFNGTSTTTPTATPHLTHTPSLMSLTPGEIAGGALGGYALPTVRDGTTLESVLASMSPQTRRYTERLMSLSFAQLAAGAGGHP